MATRQKLITILAGLAVIAVAVVLVAQYNKESRAAVQKAPTSVPVRVAPIVAKTMPVRLAAIGNIEPFTTVAVKARVDGQLVSVKFKEGDEVRKGSAMFEIDPRPFAASLKQAQANLARDRALFDRASEQEKRYKDLLTKNFISPDAYEQVRTNTATAAATLSADEAAIENAKLSLEYCTIRSRGGRWPGRVTAPDAVHHAGDLSLFRAAAAVVRHAPRQRAAGHRGWRPGNRIGRLKPARQETRALAAAPPLAYL